MTVADLKAYLHDLGVSRAYTIAFGMRSGSTALSNALYASGMGRPTEYFQYPYDSNPHFRKSTPASLFDQVRELIRSAIQPPFFAAKMTYDHLARLLDVLSRHYAGTIDYETLFPTHEWIYLRRLDKIDQAVSWQIAEASGRWHAVTMEGSGRPTAYNYDFFSLLAKLFFLHQNDLSWDLYFQKHRIAPYILYHEDIRADAGRVVKGIIDHLGFDASAYDVDFTRDSGIVDLSRVSRSAYATMRERFCDDLLQAGREDKAIALGTGLTNWNRFFHERLWTDPALN